MKKLDSSIKNNIKTPLQISDQYNMFDMRRVPNEIAEDDVKVYKWMSKWSKALQELVEVLINV